MLLLSMVGTLLRAVVVWLVAVLVLRAHTLTIVKLVDATNRGAIVNILIPLALFVLVSIEASDPLRLSLEMIHRQSHLASVSM